MQRLFTIAIFLSMLLPPMGAYGQITSWMGNQQAIEFENANFWSNQVPGPNTIAFIGTTVAAENSSVLLNQDHSIGGMLLTDGMQLYTNGNSLVIDDLNNGGLTISGLNMLPGDSVRRTSLVHGAFNNPFADLIVNGDTTISDGGELRFINYSGANLSGGLTIGLDSLVTGDGYLVVDSRIENNGTIQGVSGGLLYILSEDVDLDGNQGSGTIDASEPNSRIYFGGSLFEPFDGVMTIGNDSEIAFFSDFELDFYAADIEFVGETEGRLVISDENRIFSALTRIIADGIGRISEGTINTSLIGRPAIEVRADAALSFGLANTDELSIEIDRGSWTVDQNGILDFEENLTSASDVAVILQGGTIKGEGSNHFINNNSNGIRGFGQFELPLRNDNYVASVDGLMVVDGIGKSNDWDGINNNGQLLAITGDMLIKDDEIIETNVDIRLGQGREFRIEAPGVELNGYIELDDSTLTADDYVHFLGNMEVFNDSNIEMTLTIYPDAEIQLNGDLHFDGPLTQILASPAISGPGKIVNESTGYLQLSDTDLFVDVENHGTMTFFAQPNALEVNIDGDLTNTGVIRFRLFPDNVIDKMVIDGTVATNGGVFEVFSLAESQPGDEYDVMDFNEFQGNGYSFDLPDLWPGMFWDTSDFETEGILRIGGVRLGDVNQDGTVNLLDIDPFIELIQSGEYQAEADINQDGVVNLLDVNLFVDLLNGP